MTRLLVCSVLALADLVICLSGLVLVGIIMAVELADQGKFPLSVYAWKEMR